MTLTQNDIEDGKRLASVFSSLSEEAKMMALAYLSALRDKEVADSENESED